MAVSVSLSHSSPTRQQPKRGAGLPARFTREDIELGSPSSLTAHNPEPARPPATSATSTTSPRRDTTLRSDMRVAKTTEQAGYDSATSAYKRRQYKKNPKRQTKADKLRQAAVETEAKALLAYLDDLLTFAQLREEEDIRVCNQAQSQLYEGQTRPADWEVTGRRCCQPRPRVWERKIVKQAWEDTPTAKSLNSTLVYTEADDFSTSEDEPDEPQIPITSSNTNASTPATSSTTAKFVNTLNLLDLADPLIRAILSVLFSDCMAKYQTPAWYFNARVILALSPEEEDWLEARYRGFLNANALAAATWAPDELVWHAEACREYRLYRSMKLEHDPAPVLAWLEHDQSVRQEEKVNVGMLDVQLAERYLRARGFNESTIKRFDLDAYVNIGDEREGDDANGNDDNDRGGVVNGILDEVVDTVEQDDVVMADADADSKADATANAEPSPARVDQASSA